MSREVQGKENCATKKRVFERHARAPSALNRVLLLVRVPLITRVFNITNERRQRALFATVLFNCPPASPMTLWESSSRCYSSSPSGVALPISRPNPSKWHTVACLFSPQKRWSAIINIVAMAENSLESHCSSRQFVPNTFLLYFVTQIQLRRVYFICCNQETLFI